MQLVLSGMPNNSTEIANKDKVFVFTCCNYNIFLIV
nr:MAG TPA: hypothetical protein [Caudoviricetes sp.]